MELTDVLVTVISTLIAIVLAHLAVFWVVKTLYPPLPPSPVIVQEVAPVYVPAPVIEQPVQHVELPTYETPKPVAPPSEERKGPPPPEPTSIRGNAGVDTPDA